MVHLSPFRYPGGKSWLAPEIVKIIEQRPLPVLKFVEPFCGGASVGLAVAHARLAEKVILSDMDPKIHAVWAVIFGPGDPSELLVRRILDFKFTRENVERVLSETPDTMFDLAFQTIIRNRAARGGVMAQGAGLLRDGEGRRGFACRWYPKTLANRIRACAALRERVVAYSSSFETLLSMHMSIRWGFSPHDVWFIDPPYSVGQRAPGRRLYDYHEVDYDRLFKRVAGLPGLSLMTVQDTAQTRSLAKRYGFSVNSLSMFTAQNVQKKELLLVLDNGL